jgi:ribosomal protein S18 acetylase RimI-like enzyme
MIAGAFSFTRHSGRSATRTDPESRDEARDYLLEIPGSRVARAPRNNEYVATPFPRAPAMQPPTIRPARPNEYDEIARVWMNGFCSTGLEAPSNFLLATLRARVPLEVEKGWSLFVADDDGAIAAMLAMHLPKRYLDQLFVAPEYQGRSLGRTLLAFTREHLPDEIELRCIRENEKAWRWYEREGFIFEKEALEPMTGFVMKYYRWKREEASR